VPEQLNQSVLIPAPDFGEPLEAAIHFNANHRALADLLTPNLTDLALFP